MPKTRRRYLAAMNRRAAVRTESAVRRAQEAAQTRSPFYIYIASCVGVPEIRTCN
jgi:hypothetical protein